QQLMDDLIVRAGSAKRSPKLVEEDGKTKGGRSRAASGDTLSAKVICAVIVQETWTYFHGSCPSVSDTGAAKAADAYWRSIGLRTASWGDNPHKA
ncbi:hypothetical protein, partial [Streptomyces galilaeus]|uniref:hypothetical protein n=1 Tax=Streptomyces galilaeus TaxID=33899 RepID=UPI0038F7D3C9